MYTVHIYTVYVYTVDTYTVYMYYLPKINVHMHNVSTLLTCKCTPAHMYRVPLPLNLNCFRTG